MIPSVFNAKEFISTDVLNHVSSMWSCFNMGNYYGKKCTYLTDTNGANFLFYCIVAITRNSDQEQNCVVVVFFTVIGRT